MVTAGALPIVVCAALAAMAAVLVCWVAMVVGVSVAAMVVRRVCCSAVVATAARVLLVSMRAGAAMVGRPGCWSGMAAAVATGCMCLFRMRMRMRMRVGVRSRGLLFGFPVWAAMAPMVVCSTVMVVMAVTVLMVCCLVRVVSPAVMAVMGI